MHNGEAEHATFDYGRRAHGFTHAHAHTYTYTL